MEIIIAHIMQESKKADDPKTKIPTGLLYASDASRNSAIHQHHKLTYKTRYLLDLLHVNGWTRIVRLGTTHQANTQIHTIRMKMTILYSPTGKQIKTQKSLGPKTLLIKTMDENFVPEPAIATNRTINMMTRSIRSYIPSPPPPDQATSTTRRQAGASLSTGTRGRVNGGWDLPKRTEIPMTTDLTNATTQITMISVIHDPLSSAHLEDKGVHRYRYPIDTQQHRSIDAPDQMKTRTRSPRTLPWARTRSLSSSMHTDLRIHLLHPNRKEANIQEPSTNIKKSTPGK
jgi:hypothetical protein